MNLNGIIKHPHRHLKRSSAWTIVTTATAAVALAGSFVVSTSASTERPSPSATGKPVALTVTAADAQLRQWPRIVEGDGPIAAWDEASIGAVVGGLRIVQLSANIGDVVVKGGGSGPLRHRGAPGRRGRTGGGTRPGDDGGCAGES